MKPADEDDPWQVLGLARDADPEEIRRAYERLSDLLVPGSLPLYAAAEPEEQRQLQQRLREAYLRLMGGGELVRTRGAREASVTPRRSGADEPTGVEAGDAGAPSTAGGAPAAAVPATATTAVSGSRLRALREATGLSLRELSDRTRIRPQQLANLEEEAWDVMPPRVYVRGFVMAYARALGLDGEEVWTGFEKRWRAARPPKE